MLNPRLSSLLALSAAAVAIAACSGTPATTPGATVPPVLSAIRKTSDAGADALSARALTLATATPSSARALTLATPTPVALDAPVAVPVVAQHAVCDEGNKHVPKCQTHKRDDVAANPDPKAAAALIPGLHPHDIQQRYKMGGGGDHQTIAIVDASYDTHAEADLNVYRATFNLGECTTANGCFRAVYLHHGRPVAIDPAATQPDPNWAQEIALDIEMASAGCPKCRILLLQNDEADIDQLAAANDVAVSLGATVVSNSYGAAENPTLAVDEVHFNHPGVPITASAGDARYVEYPASSMYVTAVGGTDLVANKDHAFEQRWPNSGSGCSQLIPRPAWQRPSSTCAGRVVPDVSVIAGVNPGIAVYDSVPATDGSYGWIALGGTSAGAPLVAAMYALAASDVHVGIGASMLYTRAKHDNLFPVLDPGANYSQQQLDAIAKTFPFTGNAGGSGLGSPAGVDVFKSH